MIQKFKRFVRRGKAQGLPSAHSSCTEKTFDRRKRVPTVEVVFALKDFCNQRRKEFFYEHVSHLSRTRRMTSLPQHNSLTEWDDAAVAATLAELQESGLFGNSVAFVLSDSKRAQENTAACGAPAAKDRDKKLTRSYLTVPALELHSFEPCVADRTLEQELANTISHIVASRSSPARKDIDLTGLVRSNLLGKRQASLEKKSKRRINLWIGDEDAQVVFFLVLPLPQTRCI